MPLSPSGRESGARRRQGLLSRSSWYNGEMSPAQTCRLSDLRGHMGHRTQVQGQRGWKCQPSRRQKKRAGTWGREQRWTVWGRGEVKGICGNGRGPTWPAHPRGGMPQGSCTTVKASVGRKGVRAPAALNLTSFLPPHFGRGHSGAEVQVLGWSVLGGLPETQGDRVPVHRGIVPISCQPAPGAWAQVLG